MLHHHDTLTSALAPFVERLISRSILSEAEQKAILCLPATTVQVLANHDFVGLGQEGDHACFVAAGLVGRFDQNSVGNRQITALHIPGDMADLHSVVQPTATSALQALTTSTLLRVPHAALRKLARDHPAIAEAFWRDTTVDAMVLAQWIVNLGRRDARSRIAHLLCEMASRHGAEVKENALRLRLPMTQTQLADACGLTPVHVNRSLQALAREGTTFRSRSLYVQDWERLIDVADFDPAYLQKCSAGALTRIIH